MKKLDQDIKNGVFKSVYLLYGSQAYLKNQYRDKLVKALLPTGDTMNYAYYEGEDINIGEIIDLAETMPFLGERRVIVVENSGIFTGACDELESYVSSIPETTSVIFVEDKVDARLKLTKNVKAAGTVVEFGNLNEDDLKKWVLEKLAREHRQITGVALSKFLTNCGTDMMFISAELEKLISYTFGKDGIYPEDVDAICTVQVEDKVFLMLDAMFRHNKDEALRYYSDLLALHQAPLMILALIENQLKLMLHVKKMDGEHLSTKAMSEALSMNEYRIKKALPVAIKSSKIWLMNSLNYCADIDADSKSGKVAPGIGLELVICKLASGA